MFTIKAPATAGTYAFKWRMVRESVQWLAANTTAASIQVKAAGSGGGGSGHCTGTICRKSRSHKSLIDGARSKRTNAVGFTSRKIMPYGKGSGLLQSYGWGGCVLQAAVGGATNMAATAGQNAIEGQPTTVGQLAVSGAGGIVGSLTGSAVGAVANDFSEAAAQGAVQRMASAPVNSPAGIAVHVAETTLMAGPVGTQQGVVQAAASQVGQNAAQAIVGEKQKELEDKIN